MSKKVAKKVSHVIEKWSARRNARVSGKLLKGLEGSESEPKVPISVDRRSVGRRKSKQEEERLGNVWHAAACKQGAAD